MKVYRVRADVNAFQYLVAGDKHAYGSAALRLDGRALGGEWVPPRVHGYPPHLREGRFLKFVPGGLVLAPDAVALLRPLLEPVAELLPVHFRGQPYALVNVLAPVDCLDPAGTRWIEKDGRRIHIRSYAFDPARVPAAALFKIPEEATTKLFTAEGPGGSPFKAEVERLRLDGLVFEPVWEGP